jgi:hypothetical protein
MALFTALPTHPHSTLGALHLQAALALADGARHRRPHRLRLAPRGQFMPGACASASSGTSGQGGGGVGGGEQKAAEIKGGVLLGLCVVVQAGRGGVMAG